MAAAAKKVVSKSLVDRIEELEQEVEAALDALAEERRPEGIPVAWIRQDMDNRAWGKNPFRAYVLAMEGWR
jgi:hypothetical protein